jgi:flagellin-specific chaperone FliS
LKSNFWGDKTGPKNEVSNPTGLGNEVSDNILFKPFLKYDPTKERKDPIIIVPGIMGTELIRDYGDKDEIWPAVSKVVFSLFDNYLKELSLLQNGEENPDFSMTKGDIIRDIPTSDIFKGLVSELENNGGYKEGENLFVFPYDWRFSNTKNAELLKEKIDQVLADTEKDKVDIIAHSMGGLLTKEYIKENGEENKIDHLIFLGTPHLGAPKAYKALIYGDSMGFGISVNNTELLKFLNDKVVKIISQNMPSIYELLPSQKYVAGIRYISEKTIGSDPAYLDYDATKNLLIEKKVNQPMLESAETFHQGIDEIDLSDIKVSNFSACGEATLSAINIRKEVSIGPIKLKEDYKLKYANGDSTVPLDSSFGIANVDKYFVDKVSHSALPSAPDVPEAVLNALEDKAPQAKSKVFQDVSNCTPINGYILGMHSPISLDIYDTNGNHSGLDIDGNIESNIEGVSYDTIGDAKFAFIPDGLNVNVKGSATGFGTFDLSIEKVIGGETTETKFWNDVPITSTSHMSFNFNSYTNTNTIELDNNGSKRSIAISNVLSQGEDYLAVPVKITETRKQSSSGSYIIKNNSKIVTSIPNTEIKQGIVVDIKKVDIEKQPIIKKPLAKVIEKKVVINKETIIPTSNLGASVINAGQDIDFWGTIRSFFRRLFHIKK